MILDDLPIVTVIAVIFISLHSTLLYEDHSEDYFEDHFETHFESHFKSFQFPLFLTFSLINYLNLNHRLFDH